MGGEKKTHRISPKAHYNWWIINKFWIQHLACLFWVLGFFIFFLMLILCMIWEILPTVFTLVAHLTFYELIFEGCALCIISVTSPECWCAFLLHLCSNSLFTEEKWGQQPLLYLEQYIIFSLNEDVFKDLSGKRLRFLPLPLFKKILLFDIYQITSSIIFTCLNLSFVRYLLQKA